MPDDSAKDTGEPPTQDTPAPSHVEVSPEDRTELLARARAFLTSPQVRLQDLHAKRTFLAEKGLSSTEIDELLRELPPSVPPRTYPVPPPSTLPNLLVGVIRIFTWLTGASAFALLIYYRYLLPRLTRSYQARLALRNHQSALLARLAESTSNLKAAQAESYKDLPRTVPVYEDVKYAEYHVLDDLLSYLGSSQEDPVDMLGITILRCSLEELGRSNPDGTSTEELFRYLESKISWLRGEEGSARQGDLWNQLNACPMFVSSMPKPVAPSSPPPDHPSRCLWKYVPLPAPVVSPFLASLDDLRTAFPRGQEAISPSSSGPLSIPTISARQRTLQVLSDFTGYITTQTYSLSLPSIRSTSGAASDGSPVEDELRREIRALKGLVLNRRSFLHSGAFGSSSDPPGSS